MVNSDSHSQFSGWPPVLSENQLEALRVDATTYALSHGLLHLPSLSNTLSSAIHAPLSLFPSPFPRQQFYLAQRLQRAYNVLYSRIAADEEFLDNVMGAVRGVGKVDEFVGQLWSGWKQLRDEGLVQSLQLGIFRSDYLLHAPSEPDDSVSLRQVEFNTISTSFGAMSEKAAALHRYLYSKQYFKGFPHLTQDAFPENNTIAGIVEGLVEGHKVYNVPRAQILFVVREHELNVFDQRALEYELLEKHSIHVIRQTFDDLAHSASLDPISRALHITLPSSSSLHPIANPIEISVVYFRAGYSPDDYPTPSHYATRFLLERSLAINCPSIPLQLAGGKKIQEVLTKPGILEKFLCDENKWGTEVFGKVQVEEVRRSWMGMWGLGNNDDGLNGEGGESSGMRKARSLASSLVLKPQREGGGNNIYKDAIPAFLDSLPVQEREAWIAMELIVPPSGTSNYLVRAGSATVAAEVVSELGIFGWALIDRKDGKVREKEAGWLLRTKVRGQNEGGVMAGSSVLDSVFLVD